MSLPVIGQIRNFQDVQRALESIRGWLTSQSSSSSSAQATVVQSSSAPSQFPNPITDQYISSSLKWNVDVTAVAPLTCPTGTKRVSLLYDSDTLTINDDNELSINAIIFNRVVSHENNTVFSDGDLVYV
jgi:hypothetical protein